LTVCLRNNKLKFHVVLTVREHYESDQSNWALAFACFSFFYIFVLGYLCKTKLTRLSFSLCPR